MRYIVVTGNDLERYGFRRYLYSGQQVRGEVVKLATGGDMALITSEDDRLAQDLCDRLASGLMGARSFESIADAAAYMTERGE